MFMKLNVFAGENIIYSILLIVFSLVLKISIHYFIYLHPWLFKCCLNYNEFKGIFSFLFFFNYYCYFLEILSSGSALHDQNGINRLTVLFRVTRPWDAHTNVHIFWSCRATADLETAIMRLHMWAPTSAGCNLRENDNCSFVLPRSSSRLCWGFKAKPGASGWKKRVGY